MSVLGVRGKAKSPESIRAWAASCAVWPSCVAIAPDHLDNSPVQDYVAKHGTLADYFSIEIYGDVSDDVLEKVKAMTIPFQHFKTTQVFKSSFRKFT